MIYAEVVTYRPIYGTLTYHIPAALQNKVAVGHLVRLDIRTSAEPGIVVEIHDRQPHYDNGDPITTKPILEIFDPDPVVTPEQIELAFWMSQRYLAPPGFCLWLTLPPGIVGKRDIKISLIAAGATSDDPIQTKIIEALSRRGTLTGEQIRRVVKRKDWRNAVNALEQSEVLSVESILLPTRVKPKKIQTVALGIHPDRIHDTLPHLGKPSHENQLFRQMIYLLRDADGAVERDDLLKLPSVGEATVNNFIAAGFGEEASENEVRLAIPPDNIDEALFQHRNGELDLHILRVLAREDKPIDVSWVYAQTGAKLADLKRLEKAEFVTLGEERSWRDSLAERDFVPMSPPRLSKAQRDVWGQIRTRLDDDAPTTVLLHGVTGSGKTEIYLRAIDHVLAQGRQAILLVPEIALTAQTIRRVMARFPGEVTFMGESGDGSPDVALVHSRLKQGERYDTWQRARRAEIRIVVGTRSALFTPLPDVGLIVLDEFHDPSYKQTPSLKPPLPGYHCREVAERMMQNNNGMLILGSATPDVETSYRAENNEITYLHLPERIMGHRIKIAEQAARNRVQPSYKAEPGEDTDALTIDLPPVQVVDMREELKAGNTDMFSRDLHTALSEVLERGEQAILYMNRRGASTYVFCRDCGYVAACPRCDNPLTYHARQTELQCHHCGYSEPPPHTCPNCGSARIRYFGAGTQQIEEVMHTHFSYAKTLRWDADTTTSAGSHDIILERFINRQADVLIGTQMVAKGLDLPLVTLVGVVSADVGLNLPDFRAGERTFQTLMQVAGRAGRGLRGGRVILQTYQPNHYVIDSASAHDYAGFYDTEIKKRHDLGYPPFRRLVRLLFRDENEAKARQMATQAATLLHNRLQEHEMTGTEIIGPTPCFFTRINRSYRWQVLLRGADPTAVLRDFTFPSGWLVDVDPVDIL